MAIRYTSQFTDQTGTKFTLNIFDQEYSGSSPFEFTVGAYGFRLDFEGDDRFSPIIPSTVTLPMILQNNNDAALLTNLAAAYEGRYFLEIRTGGSTITNGLLYWRGIILPEFIDVIDEAYPQQVEIVATDDLANLRNVDYLQSPEGTGYALVTGHLTNAINALRTWSITSATERFRIIDDLECFRPSNSTWISFLRTQLNFATFKDAEAEPPEYWSCYEVLEEVCLAFGLRLYWKPTFNTDLTSGFVFDAWGSHYSEDTDFIGYNYDSGAAQIGSYEEARTTFNLDSTGINRLRGWRHGYLPALKEVRRAFDYLQASPFAIDHVYDFVDGDGHFDQTVAQLNPAALVHYGSGQPMSLRMRISFEHDTFTDPGYAPRPEVRCRLRVGQYYAQRTYTPGANPGQTGLPSGGVTTTMIPNYAAPQWSTSVASIFVVLPIMDPGSANSYEFDVALDFPGLPANLTSETFSIEFWSYTVDEDGVVISPDYPLQNLKATGITLYPTDVYESQGSTIVFKATNDNTTSRLKLELPEAKISDRVGTRGGGIFALPSGGSASDRFQPTKFRYNYNTDFESNLHALVCREWLFGQASNIRRMSGTIYDSRAQGTGECLTMFDTYAHGGNNYAAITLSYTAGINQYDVELVQLARAGTGVTVPAAAFEDYIPPMPVAPSGTIASLTSTEAQVAVNFNTNANQATSIQALKAIVSDVSGDVDIIKDADNFLKVATDVAEFTVGTTTPLRLEPGVVAMTGATTIDINGDQFRVSDGASRALEVTTDEVFAMTLGAIGTSSSAGGILRVFEGSANGTNYVAFTVAASLAGSTTYILPSADGTAGQSLKTDGAGNLYWG